MHQHVSNRNCSFNTYKIHTLIGHDIFRLLNNDRNNRTDFIRFSRNKNLFFLQLCIKHQLQKLHIHLPLKSVMYTVQLRLHNTHTVLKLQLPFTVRQSVRRNKAQFVHSEVKYHLINKFNEIKSDKLKKN